MRHSPTPRIYFAPELEVLTFPAWDCLPYDRAPRRFASTSERLATLHALQRKPASRSCSSPPSTPRPSARSRLSGSASWSRALRRASGSIATGSPPCSRPMAMRRTDTVARRRRICGARRPGRPVPVGRERRRCGSISSATRSRACAASIPPTQRTIGTVDGFTLLPASETLLDEDSVKRFRSALSRAVRRHRDRRPALPGRFRRAAAGRDRPLAAVVRREAGDPVRSSRRRRLRRPRCRRRRRGRRAVRRDRRLLREPRAGADRGSGQLPAARAGDALSGAGGVGAR